MKKQLKSKNARTPAETNEVRLDKWLWAARFCKTRALAREMIQAGKVRYNGQRTKPSKIVEKAGIVLITLGFDEKEIIIAQLSDQRRGAPEAQLLYQETPQSVAKREKNALERKSLANFNPRPDHKPDKKQRRQLIQVKHQLNSE